MVLSPLQKHYWLLNGLFGSLRYILFMLSQTFEQADSSKTKFSFGFGHCHGPVGVSAYDIMLVLLCNQQIYFLLAVPVTSTSVY